jgi:hypothetical protein
VEQGEKLRKVSLQSISLTNAHININLGMVAFGEVLVLTLEEQFLGKMVYV